MSDLEQYRQEIDELDEQLVGSSSGGWRSLAR